MPPFLVSCLPNKASAKKRGKKKKKGKGVFHSFSLVLPHRPPSEKKACIRTRGKKKKKKKKRPFHLCERNEKTLYEEKFLIPPLPTYFPYIYFANCSVAKEAWLKKAKGGGGGRGDGLTYNLPL